MEQTYSTSSRDENFPEQRGEPSCSTITLRIAQYWDQHPSAWLLQAKSQFQVAGIRSQATKLHYAVMALSPTAVDEVADLLSTPLSANAYDNVKTTLLQRMAVSQRPCIQQLLSAEELVSTPTAEPFIIDVGLLATHQRDDTELRTLRNS
ncbi:hypothetical protein MTO96_042579 [Rhipicephalus appendiculatus]